MQQMLPLALLLRVVQVYPERYIPLIRCPVRVSLLLPNLTFQDLRGPFSSYPCTF